jgi:hypothetical protein
MKTVIEMAQEARLYEVRENPPYFGASEEALLRFAELVRSDEREACAKVLDEMAEDMEREMEPSTAIAYVRSKAATIRARTT